MPTWGQNSCLLAKKSKSPALKICQQTFLCAPIRKSKKNKIIQLKNRSLHPNQAIWWCCQWAGGREASCHEYKSVSWLRRWIKYAGKPIHPSRWYFFDGFTKTLLTQSQNGMLKRLTKWQLKCLVPIQEYMNTLISSQTWWDGHKGLY